MLDFQNYEKALDALKEAARCITKSSDSEMGTNKLLLLLSNLKKNMIDSVNY